MTGESQRKARLAPTHVLTAAGNEQARAAVEARARGALVRDDGLHRGRRCRIVHLAVDAAAAA